MFKILNQIRVNAACSGAILMLGIKGLMADSTDPDAKITQIYEGTNQIQKPVIARELTK